MAYQSGRKSIREAYEEHFSSMDGREVTVRRVVNIVEKRNPMPRDFDRGYNDDQWYGGPRGREYHDEGSYQFSDQRYFEDNRNFRRNSPPPRNDGPYSQQCYSRHDLRHQLGSRNRGRSGPYFRNRGRGSGPTQGSAPERKAKSLRSHQENHNDYKISPLVVIKRGNREAQPPVRSGSNTSNRSFSPDRDKGNTQQHTQKQHKPNVPTSQTPSSSAEGSPHSSGSSKEKTPASAAETEEVVAASMEPKLTPEEDLKAQRLEAIKAKALEIEKHYRQDCETFRTVVKMLVDKEPSLDNLLQAPLDKNLLEIRQRCLDDIRHFVKELDEITAQGGDEPDNDSPYSSSSIHVWTEDDFSQLCFTNPTGTEEKQEERRQPGNTGDSDHAPAGNRGVVGKQTGNMEDFTPVPEKCRPGRQEKLASAGPEDSYSEPMELLSECPLSPAHEGPIEGHQKRLQLYSRQGEKFSNAQLSNPRAWQNITYARPGWIPDRLPYLQLGERYWELKANSTVVTTSILPHEKGRRKVKVACGVTCYSHAEGPWCEVRSENGTRICILATNPTTWIPPQIGQEPPTAERKRGC